MMDKRVGQPSSAATNGHTFKETAITAYLLNGGALEHAHAPAARRVRGRQAISLASIPLGTV